MDEKVNLLLSQDAGDPALSLVWLLLAAGGCLAVATAKRRQGLAVAALTGAVIVFAVWFDRYGRQTPYFVTCAFAWALFGLFLAYAAGATAWGRATGQVGSAIVGVAGSALTLLWLALPRVPAANSLGQLLILETVTLTACLWRRWAWQRWHWLRLPALAWAVVGLAAVIRPGDARELLYCQWIWAFFALFTADILLRAWWRSSQTVEWLDAALASAAMALAFAGTYALLHGRHDGLVSPLTHLLPLALGLLGVALQRWAGRRILAGAYLFQGAALALVALAEILSKPRPGN